LRLAGPPLIRVRLPVSVPTAERGKVDGRVGGGASRGLSPGPRTLLGAGEPAPNTLALLAFRPSLVGANPRDSPWRVGGGRQTLAVPGRRPPGSRWCLCNIPAVNISRFGATGACRRGPTAGAGTGAPSALFFRSTHIVLGLGLAGACSGARQASSHRDSSATAHNFPMLWCVAAVCSPRFEILVAPFYYRITSTFRSLGWAVSRARRLLLARACLRWRPKR